MEREKEQQLLAPTHNAPQQVTLTTPTPLRPLKKEIRQYYITQQLNLQVTTNIDERIRLKGKGSDTKSVEFTSARWAYFCQCLPDIDDQLHKRSRGEYVSYQKIHRWRVVREHR